MQNYCSQWLPYFIRDWSFLPLWMRSLKPLDDFFHQLSCCSKCINPQLESIQITDLKNVESAINNIQKMAMQISVSNNASTKIPEEKLSMEALV